MGEVSQVSIKGPEVIDIGKGVDKCASDVAGTFSVLNEVHVKPGDFPPGHELAGKIHDRRDSLQSYCDLLSQKLISISDDLSDIAERFVRTDESNGRQVAAVGRSFGDVAKNLFG